MATEIIRIKNTASSDELCSLLERDGAVIVEDILNGEQLAELNSDLDTHILEAGPGLRHPTMDAMIEFYGR